MSDMPSWYVQYLQISLWSLTLLLGASESFRNPRQRRRFCCDPGILQVPALLPCKAVLSSILFRCRRLSNWSMSNDLAGASPLGQHKKTLARCSCLRNHVQMLSHMHSLLFSMWRETPWPTRECRLLCLRFALGAKRDFAALGFMVQMEI